MGELATKVVIVTGASRGIGRVISLTLAKAGAQLVLAGRDEEGLAETARLITETGTALIPHVCSMDLLDPASIDSAVKEVRQTFGRIDVLVNNAGISGKAVPFEKLSVADWDETIDTNLKGPFLLTQAVIPAMLNQKSGSIIFIGSVTGKRPFKERSAYAASKLGLVGLMRTLALELGSGGIRVNLISPGFVAGPRLDRVIGEVAKAEGITVEDARTQMTKVTPMQKFVTPQNIADGVMYFASDRSGGVTGEDLNISGGLVMY